MIPQQNPIAAINDGGESTRLLLRANATTTTTLNTPPPTRRVRHSCCHRTAIFFKILAALILLACIITLITLSSIHNSPVQKLLLRFLRWLQSIPKGYAVLLFIAFYTGVNTLFIPGTPLDLAAGFMFGMLFGSVAACVGLLSAACLSFLLGRTLFRSWAVEKAKSIRTIRVLDTVISEKGFLLVLLLRLSPLLPFAVCSYVLGSMNIGFIEYSLASGLGLLLPTCGYVYLGTLITEIGLIFHGGARGKVGKIIWMSLAAVSTVLVLIFVSWMTKRTLNRVIAEEESKQKPKNVNSIVQKGQGDVESQAAASYQSTQPLVSNNAPIIHPAVTVVVPPTAAIEVVVN